MTTPLGDKSDGFETDQRQLVVVGRLALIGVSLLMLVVLGRVAQLQVAPGQSLASHFSNRTSFKTEQAPRGELRDRRGRILATSSFGWRLFADPTRFPATVDAAILSLADAIGASPDEIGTRILERVARNERRAANDEPLIQYVSLSHALEEWQVDAVRRLNIPGVHLERIPVRRMTDAPGVATLVGLVGVEHQGLLGAERSFDRSLQPMHGSLAYTRDARGRTMWVEVGSYRPSSKGENIRLSVDLAVQQIAIEELNLGVDLADAAGGRVIIMDSLTGELLAMADVMRDDVPAVPFDRTQIDPNTERGPRFQVLRQNEHAASIPALARNRCVEDVYEPGSTFKPFMWAAVTELGRMSPTDELDTHDGRWRTPYGRPLEDVTPRDRQSWRDVLVNSSNIGMAQGVALISYREMRDAVLKLGFGRPVGVGLPGEAAGIVTSARDWSKYTQTSVAMGYEVAVTPLQMVRAFSAFARPDHLAGTIPTTRLTAERGEPQEQVVYRVFPPDIALMARDAMTSVVAKMDERMERAGRYDHSPRYTMFGKSGTANIPRPDGRGYIEGQYISSFIAGAPLNQSRIVVLVVIDDPGPELAKQRRHYGSAVAGPVVRRIVERVLPYLGVSPAAM